MPELPEVETVRQSLETLILGSRILSIHEITPGVLLDWSCGPAKGLAICAIRRRGKYLLMELEQGEMLVAHLRMTGQFNYLEQPTDPRKHDHIRFDLILPDGRSAWLIFHDTRRFGRIWRLHESQLDQIGGLASLGPEPLDPALNGTILQARLQRRARTSLKAALLDQTVIAGLGNIYADESLFLAGLHPNRTVGTLNTSDTEKLLACLRMVLTKAVQARGTSIKDYVDALNVRGTFQYQLQVYGRGGLPCNRCGRTLDKLTVAGRTTVCCRSCQSMGE